jgi:outer membrane protein assembly factor BamD (BamD/ComL family)
VTTSANLRAELEALDTVRANLAGGDFFRGLSLLEAYFQNFHRGRLHLEAEVLRIDALARAGQPEAARSYAKEFLRRHPKSVHAARLQSIAGQ